MGTGRTTAHERSRPASRRQGPAGSCRAASLGARALLPGDEALRDTRTHNGGREHDAAARAPALPGHRADRPRRGLLRARLPAAVAALILGLLFFIPGTGAIAAILGLWALRRLRGSYDAGLTQAWFGVVVGGAATAAWLWIWCLITLPG